MALFTDSLHQEFAEWSLGFGPYGGADYGELLVLAGNVTPGDDDSFFDAFATFARRRIEEGDAASAKGHDATARDCYIRAASYLAVAVHVLYGTPVDPRLVDAFQLQMETFDKAVALGPFPAEKLHIPYEGTTIPGYFMRATGYENEVRPTILVGGGWDSTMVENYLGIGAAALARGYHILLHDGPGQGRLLIDEGLPLRYDWEKVIGPVVDAALEIDVVDADAVVYEPWSLGGYMAPRVAAFEHRLAAVVADPGQIDVGGKFTPGMRMLGLDEAADAKLPYIDPELEAKMMTVINGDRGFRWKIVQRGFWTNGAPDLGSFLVEMRKWKLDADTIAAITTPVLVTAAESDPVSSNAQALYDALPGPKQFMQFYDADGSGDHCEIVNRSMANRQIFDWIDDTLAARP
jgi:pimeloyl-ACP methyl ester carboxylesterase